MEMHQPHTEAQPRVAHEKMGSWCVWTKRGRRPQYFHPTQELAEAEAKRLAFKYPGSKFIVMQVTSKFHLKREDTPA